MFSDHDETSPSITAVSAPSVACSMLAVQQQKRFCRQFVDVSAARRGYHTMKRGSCWQNVCPSVCLSVTLLSHAHTVQAIVICFEFHHRTMSLVSWVSPVCNPEFRGSPRTTALTRGIPCRHRKFDQNSKIPSKQCDIACKYILLFTNSKSDTGFPLVLKVKVKVKVKVNVDLYSALSWTHL